MCAPTILQSIKAFLLLLIFLITLFQVFYRKEIPIKINLMVWVSLFIFLNFVYLIYGTHDNLNVFITLAPVYILWPVVFTVVLILGSKYINDFNLTKVFIVSGAFNSIYIIYLFLNFWGYVPDTFLLNLPINFTLHNNLGHLSFFTPNVTPLFFLLPFIIALIINYNKKAVKIKKRYLWLTLIVGLIATMMIGRRGLILVVFLSPIIVVFLNKFNFNKLKVNKRFLIGSIGVVIIILFVFILQFNFIDLLNVFFDPGSKRYIEFFQLIHGWQQHPVFGAGFGVAAEGPITTHTPGVYELSYVALLFATGLVGVLIYISLIIYLIVICMKSVDDKYDLMIPVVTGMLSLLIANASNPYIYSFDGIWILFLPLALLNRKSNL